MRAKFDIHAGEQLIDRYLGYTPNDVYAFSHSFVKIGNPVPPAHPARSADCEAWSRHVAAGDVHEKASYQRFVFEKVASEACAHIRGNDATS